MLAKPKILFVLALAFFATLIQICFVLSASKGDGLHERWLNLAKWDSDWYGCIIDNGYLSTIPPKAESCLEGNVTFFPAYPLLTTAVKKVFALDTKTALLFTAQTALFFLWCLLFLWMRKREFSLLTQALYVLMIISFPSAFYLAAGYSESLFTLCLIGFLTLEMPYPAALFGFIASAARLTGIFSAFSLLFSSVLLDKNRRLKPLLLTTVIAGSGTLLFFLYCQIKFGHWDLYFQTMKARAPIANYEHLFNYYAYFPITFPSLFSPEPVFDFISYSRMLALYTQVLICFVILLEIILKKSEGRVVRISLYFAAASVFYPSVAAMVNVKLNGVGRYTLPVQIVLLLALLDLTRTIDKKWKWVGAVILLLLALYGMCVQYNTIGVFTSNGWVS